MGLQRVGHDWSNLACTQGYLSRNQPTVRIRASFFSTLQSQPVVKPMHHCLELPFRAADSSWPSSHEVQSVSPLQCEDQLVELSPQGPRVASGCFRKAELNLGEDEHRTEITAVLLGHLRLGLTLSELALLGTLLYCRWPCNRGEWMNQYFFRTWKPTKR